MKTISLTMMAATQPIEHESNFIENASNPIESESNLTKIGGNLTEHSSNLIDENREKEQKCLSNRFVIDTGVVLECCCWS